MVSKADGRISGTGATAIIILNYNNSHDTLRCLDSIKRFNTARIKIVVVDNGSSRENALVLEKGMSQRFGADMAAIKLPCRNYSEGLIRSSVVLIESLDNLGFAKGNNLGLDLAYADSSVSFVLILNNDTLWVEDLLPLMISSLQSIPDCGIISPILYKPNLTDIDRECARKMKSAWTIARENFLFYWRKIKPCWPHDMYLPLPHNLPQEGAMPVGMSSGACMLFRKDALQAFDSLDPRTFLYFEEDILAKKLMAKELKWYLHTGAKCIHVGAASTAGVPVSLGLMKRLVESQAYYIRAYSGCNVFMRGVYAFSRWFFLASFWLQKKSGIRLSR